MNWSSGKDSAFALYKLKQANQFSVDLLLTTIGKSTNRISMHGLSREMLIRQCAAIGIQLKCLELEDSLNMEAYNQMMKRSLLALKEKGYQDCAYGDIFLEDLKIYREQKLSEVGIQGHFPLWQKNTKELMLEFLALGFKSVVVAANAKWFDEEFVGQDLTKKLIEQLPEDVDPCGENGEFHTFCFDGPIFEYPVEFKLGQKLKKSYPNPSADGSIDFWFCDLL